jgi:molybdopterin converting factor small subunit
MTKARLAALDTLLNDNKQIIAKKHSTKFATLREKTEKLKVTVAESRLTQQRELRDLAKNLIEDRRQRLTTYITETYLGMERVENKDIPLPSKASDK